VNLDLTRVLYMYVAGMWLVVQLRLPSTLLNRQRTHTQKRREAKSRSASAFPEAKRANVEEI